jgi:hypothetical protein
MAFRTSRQSANIFPRLSKTSRLNEQSVFSNRQNVLSAQPCKTTRYAIFIERVLRQTKALATAANAGDDVILEMDADLL